jgi:hypothetical protein
MIALYKICRMSLSLVPYSLSWRAHVHVYRKKVGAIRWIYRAQVSQGSNFFIEMPNWKKLHSLCSGAGFGGPVEWMFRGRPSSTRSWRPISTHLACVPHDQAGALGSRPQNLMILLCGRLLLALTGARRKRGGVRVKSVQGKTKLSARSSCSICLSLLSNQITGASEPETRGQAYARRRVVAIWASFGCSHPAVRSCLSLYIHIGAARTGRRHDTYPLGRTRPQQRETWLFERKLTTVTIWRWHFNFPRRYMGVNNVLMIGERSQYSTSAAAQNQASPRKKKPFKICYSCSRAVQNLCCSSNSLGARQRWLRVTCMPCSVYVRMTGCRTMSKSIEWTSGAHVSV